MRKLEKVYNWKQVEEAKTYLRKFWAGDYSLAYSCYPVKPEYRQLEDEEEMIDKAARNILKGAELPGFNIPHFIADFGTVSIPAYWGGERYTPEGGKMVISPLIESSEEVDEIEPVPPEKGDAGRAVKIWKEISCRLQTDNLTCSFIDMQGPLNTASLLWKQDEFMIAMHKHPEKVHQLLEQVTDQIIKIYKYMINKIGEKNIFGSLWPYIWLPPDIGVKIVEDYMPLLSPELYREFGLPYLEKISEEIGAIFIHCCGDYSHQLDNLKNSSINLLGLEFHSPYMNPEELFDKFQDKVFVPFGCEVNELVRMDKGDNRLWFVLNDETKEIKKKVKFIYNNL